LRIFENRVLRRILGPEIEETRGWRKLRNEELHNLYSPPDIITITKSRRKLCAGHATYMREMKNLHEVLD
jgi:hypothetical protein